MTGDKIRTSAEPTYPGVFRCECGSTAALVVAQDYPAGYRVHELTGTVCTACGSGWGAGRGRGGERVEVRRDALFDQVTINGRLQTYRRGEAPR